LVLALCNAERVGGRTRRLGSDRLELLDCTWWSHWATEDVQRRFPEVVVDVRACRQSLTGLSVVFIWRGGGRMDVLLYIVIAVGLTCCAYTLVTSPWWGAYRWIHNSV
jgi:hypothetical protein